MEEIKCEEIEIDDQIETDVRIEHVSQSSVSYQEVEQIILKESSLLKRDTEIKDKVHAETDPIKYEGTVGTGQFAAIYINPTILSKSNVVQSSKGSLKFSQVLLPSTNDKPLLCRLCATPGNDMVDMFARNKKSKDIIEKIEHCLPIMVTETDSLPKQACKLCLERLEMCYQFHICVSEAEKQFIALSEQRFGNNRPKSQLGDDEKLLEYSEPNSPMSPATEEETTSDEEVSDFESYFPPVTRNNKVSNKLIKEAKKDKNDDNILRKEKSNSEKTVVEESCNKVENKFVSKLKQNLQKLCQQSNEKPPCISDERARIKDERNSLQQLKKFHQRKIDLAVKCDICKKRFHTYVMQSHKETCGRKLPTKKTHPCTYCGKKFDRKLHAEDHERTHTGEVPYKCEWCMQNFRTRRTYLDHLKLHRGERLFKCSKCEQTFTKICGLRGHARVCNQNLTKIFQCDICQGSFCLKGSLVRHLKTQHSECF